MIWRTLETFIDAGSTYAWALSSASIGHGAQCESHGRPNAQHELRMETTITSITLNPGPLLQVMDRTKSKLHLIKLPDKGI